MVLTLNGYLFHFSNPFEFILTYWEVFKSQYYHFNTNEKSPVIIDGGSHIGLSILYFKKLYPGSTIIAFEPNPKTFAVLKRNIELNNIQGVTLINAALSKKNGQIKFYVGRGLLNWSWGDTGKRNKIAVTRFSEEIFVNSVQLSSYIKKKVDFLKLDIEGMEGEILTEIKNKLKFVEKIVLEFHRVKNSDVNTSRRIIDLLKKSGFAVSIKQANLLSIPFRKTSYDNEPFRLLICAEK